MGEHSKYSAFSSASQRLCGGRWLLIVLLSLPLLSQPDPARQFESAIHREVVSGDLTGAITEYRAIATAAGTPRPIAGRALLQLGQCQEKLGQRKDAHATYVRIVREFADEREVASQAQARLA